MMKVSKVLVAVSFLFVQVIFSGFTYANEAFVMKNDELERPTGYREWIYVGTPNDMNDGKLRFLNFIMFILTLKAGKIGKTRVNSVMVLSSLKS
ncbi:MAG: hypothetical protein ACI89T_002115 [Cognaticolwellia sp.]|jgi:hypothetical protein